MARVRIKAPDGRTATVEDSELQGALDQGFSLAEEPPAPPPAAPPAAQVAAPEPAAVQAPAEPAAAPKRVRIKAPDGRTASIDESELENAKAAGFEVDGDQTLAALQGLSRWSGGDYLRELFNKGETKLQGALQEAGIVTPDVSKDYDLFQDRSEVEQNRLANPGTAKAAEVAGLVGAIASGKGPAALLSKATTAGGARLAGALAPAGSSALRTIAAKAVGLGTAGALEGGTLGAASAVNDAFLAKDYDGLAEKAVAGAAEGAKWGAIGAPVGAVASKVVGLALRGGAKMAGQVLDELAPGRLAFKAATGRTSLKAQQAAAKAGGDAAIGDTLIAKGLVRSGEVVDDIAARLPAAREEAGQQVGRMIDEVGDGTTSSAKLWERIEKEVLSPLEAAGSKDVAAAVRAKLRASGVEEALAPGAAPAISGAGVTTAAGNAAKGGWSEGAPRLVPGRAGGAGGSDGLGGLMGSTEQSIGLKALHELRKRFDDRPDMKWLSNADNDLTADGMRAVRGVIEDTFEKAADDVAKSRGVGDFAERFAKAKLEYKHLAVADKVAEAGALARAANNKVGLMDGIAGMTGAVALGPVGALVPVASKLARERFESTVAIAMSKLQERSALVHAAMVDSQAKLGELAKMGGVFAGKAAKPLPGALAAGSHTVHEVPDIIRSLDFADQLTDPNSKAAKDVQAQVMELHADDPEMGVALAKKIDDRAAFIRSKAPAPSVSGVLDTPTRQLSKGEAKTLAGYIDAADNPMKALERISQGKPTPQDVETLQTLYPTMYAEFRAAALSELTRNRRPMTRDQRLRVSYAIGAPVDPATGEEYAAWLQRTATAQSQVGKASDRKPGMDPESYEARSDKLQ